MKPSTVAHGKMEEMFKNVFPGVEAEGGNGRHSGWSFGLGIQILMCRDTKLFILPGKFSFWPWPETQWELKNDN